MLKQSLLEIYFLMYQIAILPIFADIFTLDPFLTLKATFLGAFVKISNVDNGQGFLEHISHLMHLHWFLRYLIRTLSRTFENRLVEQPRVLVLKYETTWTFLVILLH